MSKSVTRLFEQFQPSHYNLLLDVDPEAMTFSGNVVITGKKVGRPSQRITLHQKGLKITSATVRRSDKKGEESLEIERVNNQDSFDEVRLHTKQKVYPGEYTLSVAFEGRITDPMHGIYPCYFKHDGKDKKLIATQFESHHAREAFPCIDEPEAKATFDLVLGSPAHVTALSNMPVKDQIFAKVAGKDYEPAEQADAMYMRTFFETTPRMSTYLLAFVVGEMHQVSATTKEGVEVSSWATVAQDPSHLQYANDEAVKLLELFNDFFQTPFPLPKLDQVALPDFDSLAMENWGLVTYREVGLLSDPNNRSLSGEQLITMVIAHELSHQWFGNLVTMKWWDDLWLNESFAEVMGNIGPDRLHPDWEQWEEFATGRGLSASNRDQYKDVQSVSVPVDHPDQISSLFDPAIVYAKGARLVDMLQDYMGEDAFRAGLKEYFAEFAYQNATRDDLWRNLDKAAPDKDIPQLMTPWIIQSGMPMLSVSQQDGSLQLRQQRFLLDGEDTDSIWPIPLLTDTEFPLQILENREATVAFDGDVPMFNANGTGHYVVNYEDQTVRDGHYQRIAARSVGSMERINLLNDMMLLARHGELSLVEILKIVEQCTSEPRDAVWTMLARAVAQSQTLTDGDKQVEAQIKQFKAKLVASWYDKLGWDDQPDDDPNTKHLRTTALALSIAGERKDAIDKALELYHRTTSTEKLPAELRNIIVGAVVRFGDPAAIESLMTEYETTQNSDLQESIAAGLCSTRDPKVAQRIIGWGLTPKTGVVRQQDLSHWFVYLMRNFYTRDVAWQWLTESWEHLEELFGGGKHMEYFVWYAAGPLSTPEWRQKFNDFFEPKLSEAGLERNIRVAINEIAARVAWRQREESALKAFYAKRS